MLILKLTLVPAFLLLISLAGRRWGPEVAGWLAGLPVLTGPILFLLALENGPVFAAAAAAVSLAGVSGAIVFILVYAHACARHPPALSLCAGLAAWGCNALLLTSLPLDLLAALGIALGSLLLAPKLLPRVSAPVSATRLPKWELPLRMLAGAALTLGVTSLAASIGPSWSGVLAVFPVIALVLAVFSHRSSGPAFTVTLLKAMARGLYGFSSFCLALAALLPQLGLSAAFLAATAVAIAVHAALRLGLHSR